MVFRKAYKACVPDMFMLSVVCMITNAMPSR